MLAALCSVLPFFCFAGAVPPVDEPLPYIKATDIVQYGAPKHLGLRSETAVVIDDREGVMLYGQRADAPRPIASLTKVMTALVILESGLPLEEGIPISQEDRDRLRGSRSRLPFGALFTRRDLLRAALGASDNRAAAALARTYPGGTSAFVMVMNTKARILGMMQTRFADASGLSSGNISTAADLARLLAAAGRHPLLPGLTTASAFSVLDKAHGRSIDFNNTNRFVGHTTWDIHLSKTGYTADAGNCIAIQTVIGGRPLTIVLLNSWGKLSKYGDLNRVRAWLLEAERRVPQLLQTHAAN